MTLKLIEISYSISIKIIFIPKIIFYDYNLKKY